MPAEERPVKDDVGKDGKLRFIKWERIARSLKSEETGMESTKLKKVPESEKKSVSDFYFKHLNSFGKNVV